MMTQSQYLRDYRAEMESIKENIKENDGLYKKTISNWIINCINNPNLGSNMCNKDDIHLINEYHRTKKYDNVFRYIIDRKKAYYK